MNESVKTYTVEEAKRRLERYCAYQERSHRQVREKLREMRMIPLATDGVIVHLIKHDFHNEERFARSYARGKFRLKKWGRDYLIEAGLEEIDEDEYQEVFDTVAEKKFASIKDTNPYKAKAKLANYLLYRGFEPDLVYSKIDELYEE